MQRFIRSIRRKPKAVRDQYAFWGAFAFTAVVAFVWVSSGSTGEQLVETLDTTAGDTQTAASTGSLRDMMSDIRTELSELTQTEESPVTPETPTASDQATQFINNEISERTVPEPVPQPDTRPTPTVVRIATTSSDSN